jgi:hypothetical protein
VAAAVARRARRSALQLKKRIGNDWTLPCAALQARHAILPWGLLSLELNLKERQNLKKLLGYMVVAAGQGNSSSRKFHTTRL